MLFSLFIYYYERRTEYTNIKRKKKKIWLVQQYSSIKSVSLLYNVILAKLCLKCNNSRMTFMFEMSESENKLLQV